MMILRPASAFTRFCRGELVDDCIDHLLWLAEHDYNGGLFNSGTGTARSFKDLATAVFAAMNLQPNISYIDMPADLARQYQNYTHAPMRKLHDAGCRSAVTSLETGTGRYLEWINASETLG